MADNANIDTKNHWSKPIPNYRYGYFQSLSTPYGLQDHHQIPYQHWRPIIGATIDPTQIGFLQERA